MDPDIERRAQVRGRQINKMVYAVSAIVLVIATGVGAGMAAHDGHSTAGHAALVAVVFLVVYGAIFGGIGLLLRRLGRRRGWWRPSPMLALDRRERRRVWRAARRGEPLTQTESEIVQAHVSRMHRRRWLAWFYPAITVFEITEAITDAHQRWLFVASACLFAIAGAAWPFYLRWIDRISRRLGEPFAEHD
ncbi:MAG: hypothetical protein ACRDV3_00325 [Acidothermaceae bacterium]